MPVDPTIALRASQPAFDIGATMQNALTMRGLQQTNQLNQMKLAAAQQAAEEENALRGYLSSSDLSTPEGMSGLLKFGKAGADISKTLAERAKTEQEAKTSAATEKKTLGEYALKKADTYKEMLAFVNTPQDYVRYIQMQRADPDMAGTPVHDISEQELAANLAQIPTDPNAFNDFKGKVWMGIDKWTTSQREAASAAETKRHNIATEENARARLNSEKETGVYSPETIDYLAQIYNQTGSIPPLGLGASNIRMQIFERARQQATEQGQTTVEAATSVSQAKQTKAAEQNTLRVFSSGLEGRMVRANNTAINHLETMDKLVADLANKDTRIVNKAANLFAKETGSAAPTNFDAAKQIVAAEVIKAIVQNGGGVTERQEAAEQFSRANSPEQLKGVLNTYRELLGGQLQSLKQQYEAGTNRKDFETRLSPNTRKLLTPATTTETTVQRPAGVPANWTLHTDAKGNKAYVSPDGKQFKEVK